jgi:hypothetical protein
MECCGILLEFADLVLEFWETSEVRCPCGLVLEFCGVFLEFVD